MFALFLIALFALAAIAVAGVLADSGLRWWSAFGQLRREMRRTAIVAELPELRPAITHGGHASFGRGQNPSARVRISRAA